MNKPSLTIPALAVCALTLTKANLAFADGSESLGAPTLTVENGSGVLAAGTGLFAQPGEIELNVPAGATVKQVLLYWDGAHHLGASPDDTIVVDGIEVTGTVIGGPTTFFSDPFNPALGEVLYTAFRADITSLDLVSAGPNVLAVEGLNNTYANDGAGILVIFQQNSDASQIELRDGLDLAWWKFSGELQVTEPQTFTFEASEVARTASLTLFVGSVDQNRPNQIHITVDGQESILVDELFSNDGDQWDTLTVPVSIPAGATTLTVELVSTPADNSLGGGASFAWLAAALSVPLVPSGPEITNPGTRTPGYWKNHPSAWPGDTIDLGGLTYTKLEAIAIMQEPARGDKTLNLAEHLIAAKLNVAVGNDSSCVSQAIADADAFLAAYPIGSGVPANSAAWKGIEATFDTLVQYNEGHLCVAKGENNAPEPINSERSFTRVKKEGKKVSLGWKGGRLESAERLNGPWTPVSDATNPSTLPATDKMRFFRVR